MKKIVNELKKKGLKISTMESCTGGFIASEITNVSGASDIINFSAVTYSDEFKIKMGVSKNIIDEYTVYSVETAKEMSESIARFSNSNIGIGVTGKMDEISDEVYRLNNKIYISIYNRDTNQFYVKEIVGKHYERIHNKMLVRDTIISVLYDILGLDSN